MDPNHNTPSPLRTFTCLAVVISASMLLADEVVTLNLKDSAYRGIWYMNQPSGDEYVYKYSGGLGTYCAKHKPFAVYAPAVDKTFFCYGGTTADSNTALVHMVSYFDHKTRKVPRPTILLDKQTSDAHDNPVISMDDDGYVWIFSTSHGTARPSYIHRSTAPYYIDSFELIRPFTRDSSGTPLPITNFSYMQAWHIPQKGFACFFTRYNYPAKRTICFMSSTDGVSWSKWQRLAAIDEGHYQISSADSAKAASAFNYHPVGKGLNWRTNLYYIESTDLGKTWHSIDGNPLDLPLTDPHNPALVCDYESKNLNVYLKDIRFDSDGFPVILYVTSKGYKSGPANDPRTWTITRYDGTQWVTTAITTSDNNYDMGSLYIETDGLWRLIAPTSTGPQPYNPGGEVAVWTSIDKGKSWKKTADLTANSPRNHTYVRRPLNPYPDFYALWADGNARKPSISRLYFCDKQGNTWMLPNRMTGDFASPIR